VGWWLYEEAAMKNILLVACASLLLSGHAFAGEEIQLAAAIGAGSSTTVETPEATASGEVATGAIGGAGSTAAAAASMGTASMVTIGVLAAGAIAVLASGGGSSTSHH
jgi:hypothetical protein